MNIRAIVLAFVAAAATLSAPAAWAKREANDPRRLCREAIQKANGQDRDARVSRKALDRCVANGGKL